MFTKQDCNDKKNWTLTHKKGVAKEIKKVKNKKQTIVLLCLPLLIYFPWAEAQSAETEGSEGRMKKKKK